MPRMIRKGSRGEDVVLCQRSLSQLGYVCTADGIFRSRTETQVKRYQLAHGLSVDGIVGPSTWEVLLADDSKIDPCPAQHPDKDGRPIPGGNPDPSPDDPEPEPIVLPDGPNADTAPAAPPLEELGIIEFPAWGGTQTAASRGAAEIDMVVIHTSEGDPNSSYGPQNWFADPQSQGSAHYSVIANTEIYRSVPDHDIAWHAGNSSFNARSIGIEIQAQAAKANWNEEQLRTVATLTASLSARYGVPIDRDHIIGHGEVPNQTHWDPGPDFPWDDFMWWVREAAGTTTIT